MPETPADIPSIVTIGGGTGSFTLLQEFKNHFENITAIVNMADDGGSTGMLRDELGVLPPGDVRQCLVALSEAPEEMRQLFNFRFTEGKLKGHAFGNIFLSAVEMMASNNDDAVRLASEVLRIKGRVLPVTKDQVRLELRWNDDEVISGEYHIGQMDFSGKSKPAMRLVPQATLNPAAAEAIATADAVVIAPGNLYGSIAPVLIVPGMREALESTGANVTYVCNLVTKPGQTDNFRPKDFVEEIHRFIGAPVVDTLLYNTETPEEHLLQKYIRAGELLVRACNDDFDQVPYTPIGLNLISDSIAEILEGDAIGHTRSFIRHDARAVAEQLMTLYQQRI